jgi:hypothetical protein
MSNPQITQITPSWIPAKVREYFKSRGSRARMIWPYEVKSQSAPYVQVGWASAKMQRRHGPMVSGKAWPIDTEIVQWTDGVIYADFTRRELMESGVAA